MCKQEERDSFAFGTIPAVGAAGVNAISPSDRTGRTRGQRPSAEDSRGLILSLIFLPPGSRSESSSPALEPSPAACLQCVDYRWRKRCVTSI